MPGRVGVAIVHFGHREPTLRCLESVWDDPGDAERQVVLVDNQGNLDGEVFETGTRVLRLDHNPGFGAGANAGMAALSGLMDALVVLNNDVQLLPGFLDAAVAALGPGIGAVGGPVVEEGGEGRLWYAGGRVRYLTGTVWQSQRPRDAARARDVGFIPGAAMAFAPQAWRQVGGFDPSYFLYNEDLDICLRLRRAGWRLRFEPGMACVHDVGGSTGSRLRSPLYLEHMTRSRLRPFRSSAYRLYLLGVHSLYNLVRVAWLRLQHGDAAGPYVEAVLRGHLAAARAVLRSQPKLGRERQH